VKYICFNDLPGRLSVGDNVENEEMPLNSCVKVLLKGINFVNKSRKSKNRMIFGDQNHRAAIARKNVQFLRQNATK
jgi:hypothetical protein